jgi:ribonucleoside-diphosphate reductase alpha chain
MKNDLPMAVSSGIIKRDGTISAYDPHRIRAAVYATFMRDAKGNTRMEATSQATRNNAENVTLQVLAKVESQLKNKAALHIEDVQDYVELFLMRMGMHTQARDFVLYRESKRSQRSEATDQISITLIDGTTLSSREVTAHLRQYVSGMAAVEELPFLVNVNVDLLSKQVMREIYQGASKAHYKKALLLATKTMIERHPDYDTLYNRITLHQLACETAERDVKWSDTDLALAYRQVFQYGLDTGCELGLINRQILVEFDIAELSRALNWRQDALRDTLSMSTLQGNYLLKDKRNKQDQRIIELPQTMLMRVAMGLALNEPKSKTQKALEFYEVLSGNRFLSATPTLFNSGTNFPQLSSCFLTTVPDDLGKIFTKGITQNAMLQKWAGGLGNDWTPVRAAGALIKTTNGESSGIVPYLKIVNDTAVAVNQGGKRKGAVCAYLETWHADIESFLDLRKNTGDDRIRTHDMNTANWIPDLFMKRMLNGEKWSLFSPDEAPELHDLYGDAFERAYKDYEQMGREGRLRVYRQVDAKDLWRKMLTMLFETGHPWITFKDACNLRSPQSHVGVIHSSNLCTEITLNTSEEETAVCNLGSVNITKHLTAEGKIDSHKLQNTVKTAVRMLDNVIDVNLYATEEARTSNLRHRPIAMGIMGLQETLHKLNMPYDSQEAYDFSDAFMEQLCYYAYQASAELAQERGSYQSFVGSDWSKGILPFDTVLRLRDQRSEQHTQELNIAKPTLNWESLRKQVMKGMRNSNNIAIAPTATIANIAATSPSSEPMFGVLSVKSNLNGEFTIINRELVKRLEVLGLWDEVMMTDIKAADGSIQKIERIPADTRHLFRTAFEIDPMAVIHHAARRGVWMDQAQSTNVYVAGVSGKKLDAIYTTAWKKGLKTTYYLRSVGATSAEKSTIATSSLNAVASQAAKAVDFASKDAGVVCTMRPGDAGFEECEACQ